MAKSDTNYADPTGVLRSLINDNGNPVEIGPERDIGEFNDTLLSRVQEGLNYKKIYAEMVKAKAEKDAQRQAAKPSQDDIVMEGQAPPLNHQVSSIVEDQI